MARRPEPVYTTPVEALAHRTTEDAIDKPIVDLHRLDERVTMEEIALLQRAAEHPIAVSENEGDTYGYLWLTYYKLLGVWIDPHDRIWIRTTQVGMHLLTKLGKTPR